MPTNTATLHTNGASDGTPDSSTTGKHIPALDGIRGLAILLVFAIHFLWSGNDIGGHNPILWLGLKIKLMGWVGVDLFFVLSGFLITGILYDTLKDPHFFRNFYARRMFRIFPLYYGFIALATVLLILFGGHWDRTALVQLLTYTQNLSFPISHSPYTTTLPWLEFNHFWSLAIEEQFYLVWPLVVFLLKTKQKICIAAVVGILLSFTIRIVLSKTPYPAINPYLLYSWTPSHLDGLLIGALLAVGIRSTWEQFLLKWCRPVFAVCFVLLCLMERKCPDLVFPHYWFVSIWGIPLLALMFAALIAMSLRRSSWTGRIFSTKFMRFFGKYSYGLYVYHYTISQFGMMCRPWMDARFHQRLVRVLVPAAGGVLVSIVIAVLSYHLFEKRFLALKRHFEAHTDRPKLEEFVVEQQPS